MMEKQEQVFFEEPLPGGGVKRTPGTLWRNATPTFVQFELMVDGGTWMDERHQKLRPARRWKVSVPPKGVTTSPEDQAMGRERIATGVGFIFGSDGLVVIPTEHDRAVQTLECKANGCTAALRCSNPSHDGDRIVAGGLAPQLLRVRRDGDVAPAPALSPLLMEQRPTLSPEDIDARLLARARGTAGAR
jgi:hypothetical protein